MNLSFCDFAYGWPFRRRPRITHPEEPEVVGATLSNVNIYAVLNKWLIDWCVPTVWWESWRTQIVITLRDDISNPAWTYDGDDRKRHLEVRPEWLVPGVIAHEQAHNSYAMLTNKEGFELAYHIVQRDYSFRLLYELKSHIMDQIDDKGKHVEAHAEIYRYLGHRMPKILKRFYPLLA